MSLSFELGSTPTEKYQLGEVVRINEVKAADFGIPIELMPKAIYSVEIRDPYVECFTLEEQAEVRNQEQEINDFARDRRLKGYWERKTGTAYVDEAEQEHFNKHVWGDPYSSDIFFNRMLGSQAINIWKTKIPSASALVDLSNPLTPTILDKKGNPILVDYTAKKWWSLCTDGRAIRNRSTIMSRAVEEFIWRKNKDYDFCWMSIACGTALPVMQSSVKSNINPRLILVDSDKKSLDATNTLANEIGFTGDTIQYNDINIFDTSDLENLKNRVSDNLPDIVDLMGIFEYTGENIGVDPVSFLVSTYSLLSDNGRLIIGQMRDDRPMDDFTNGVVGWPYIHQRSPSNFLKIIQNAGISLNKVTLYFPDDGVYTIAVIDK